MPYSFTPINIKKSQRPVWHLIKTTAADQFSDANGSLFCVAELTKADDEKINGLKLLLNTVFELHNRGNDFSSSQTADSLEYLLEEANKKFTDICHGLPEGAFNDLSIIMGLVQNQTLVLSSHGTLEGWMIHPSELKNKSKKFRWINMLKTTPTKTSGTKLFNQIISGDLKKQQMLVMASKNVWQHFTQEKLKEIILIANGNKLSEIIFRAINQANQPIDLAILIAQPILSQAVTDKLMTAEIPIIKRTPTPTLITNLPSQVEPTTALRAYADKPKLKRLQLFEKIIISFKNWFGRLTTKNKLTFILVVVLFIIFIQSLSLINRQQLNSDTTSAKFNETVAIITTKQEAAEATLIYNDRTKAKDLLQEAITLALNLPSKNNQEKESKDNLINDINQQLDKLNNITNVSYLEPAFTLPEDIKAEQIISLYFFQAAKAALITAKPQIVFIDLASGEIVKSNLANITDQIKLTTYDDGNNTLYLVDGEGRLFKIILTASAELTAELITDITLPPTINNLVFYADKLYAANPENKQIIKIDLAKKQITAWLSSPHEAVATAVSMAIDSSIYLTSRNSVTKFFKGDATDWQIKDLNPALTNISFIQTKLDQDFIYLLEKDGQRIIKLNKDGVLIKQFVTQKWSAIKNLAINNPGTEALLLNNNEIYTLRLE